MLDPKIRSSILITCQKLLTVSCHVDYVMCKVSVICHAAAYISTVVPSQGYQGVCGKIVE